MTPIEIYSAMLLCAIILAFYKTRNHIAEKRDTEKLNEYISYIDSIDKQLMELREKQSDMSIEEYYQAQKALLDQLESARFKYIS